MNEVYSILSSRHKSVPNATSSGYMGCARIKDLREWWWERVNRKDCSRATSEAKHLHMSIRTTPNSSTIGVEVESWICRDSSLGRKSRCPVSFANTGPVLTIRGCIWRLRSMTEGVAFKHSIKASTEAGTEDKVKVCS